MKKQLASHPQAQYLIGVCVHAPAPGGGGAVPGRWLLIFCWRARWVGWGEEVDVAPGVCVWAEARAVQGEGPSGGDWERQLELPGERA